MNAVYLTPSSSLSTELRSDTLWGLLLLAIRYVLGESKAEEVASACSRGKPPFVISSAMRFVKEAQERICWLPRPKIHPSLMDIKSEADLVRLKKAKKSNFLRQDAWETLINGELSQDQLFSKLLAGESENGAEEMGNFAERDVLHVAIDRMAGTTLELDGKGQLFYTEELFIKNGGLYFLVDGDMALIEPALRYLEHVGFGGDVSIGKGKCEVEIGDVHLRTPTEPTHMVTLSLYRPTQQELSYYRQNKDRFWYELVVRSGKPSPSLALGIATPTEKSSVVAFSEGSTFPWLPQQTYGSVQPVVQMGTTNVLFNGFALMIPARFTEET